MIRGIQYLGLGIVLIVLSLFSIAKEKPVNSPEMTNNSVNHLTLVMYEAK